MLDTEHIEQTAEEVFPLLDRGKHFVLNLAKVEFMSGAALNTFILFDRAVKKHDGKLRFCFLRPEIMEVFVITRLNHMFTICETEEDALSSM
ncbi:MAG: STAS domain-containing protein [Patescibacteria group bacterium]